MRVHSLRLLLLTALGRAGASTVKRAAYHASVAGCPRGTTGDVLISLLPRPLDRRLSTPSKSPGARYAEKLLSITTRKQVQDGVPKHTAQARAHSLNASVDVEVHAVFEYLLDGLAARLSEEKLNYVLDDDAAVAIVEADCFVHARCVRRFRVLASPVGGALS
jgi:hypothetical protein